MTRPSGGADYNLGRAHGEIEITADTRGAQEAQAAMAATAAEGEVLDRTMGRVNDQFTRNQRETVLSSEAIVKHRQQVEDLQRTYTRYYEEYNRAVARTKEAEDALNRARQGEEQQQNVLLRLARDVEKARDNEERLLTRVEQSHARYQQRLQSVTAEVQRFNEAHIQASSGLNRMRVEAERVGEALENLSGKLSSMLRIVGTGGIMGLFAGGSGGTTAALGASGLSGLTNVMAGVMEMVQQLSGVLALFPAVVSGAAVSLGTLAVGFHGVSQALSQMNDANPEKFLESIRQLAPAARDVVVQIYSFGDAMRGARQMIQQSLFAPIVADIQPLIQTWLPQLMRGGQAVANEFGQMGHQFAQFMLQPQTQQAFGSFIQNMTAGMREASHAMQPLLEAWRTLTTVGSTFFPRIGQAITTMANEFNRMVEGAASSGKLQAWINSALTGFTNLGRTILNTVEALGNVFSIGDRYGGGFLAYIRQLSEEFKNWTISDRGQQTLANFFQLIQQAGQAVHPILKLLGEGIATVAGALTRLGIGIAPGVTSFFQSILQSLQGLAPVVQQLAPSINSFLTEFGRVLQQIVAQIGPQLPGIFQGLAQALIGLLPVLPPIANAIANLLSHFTPGEIQAIILAAGAVRLLSGAFGILTAVLDANPIVLVAGAIVGLGAAIYEAYQHWEPFHNAVQTVWSALQSFGNWLVNQLPQDISAAVRPIEAFVNEAASWGDHLIQNFAHGIASGVHWVEDAINGVMGIVRGHLPGSRAKYGPFSMASPEEIGTSTAQGYAAGISGGTGAVAAASSGIAGAASGIGVGGGGAATTGLSFSSAGATGKSGVGVQGNSGFDQYIKFITQDLTAWNNIFQMSFHLVTNMLNTAIQGINVAASIWGGGDNPLTRPGGIAGPPIAYGQQHVPGVPDVQIPGKAPIPALAPLGGEHRPSQQAVPGVPNVTPRGHAYVPGSAGQGNVAGPPGPAAPPPAAPGPGSAGPASSAGPPAAGDSPLVAALKQNGSFSPEQIRMIEGLNAAEGPNPAGNPTLGFRDDQLGGDSSLQGHVDALAKQFRDRQGQTGPRGVIGPFPESGSDRDKAEWVADVVGQNSSPSDFMGAQQPPREQYIQSVIRGMPPPRPGGPQQGGLAANGQLFGQQRPGVEHNEGGQTPRPAAENISSIIQTLFPQIQNIGGVRGDSLPYHPSGHALDIMIPGWDTPQGQQLGQQINDFLQRNADQLGISDTIFNRQYYKAGQPVVPFDYQGNDPDQAHLTHVHVTTMGPGGGGGDEPGNFQRNILALQGLPPGFQPPAGIAPVAGLPPGPSNALGSGLHLPGADGRFAAPLAAGAIAGGGAIAGYGALRVGSAARLAWLRYNYNRLDRAAQREVLDSLSPEERASLGRNPQVTFGETGGLSEFEGLNLDLGEAPAATPQELLSRLRGAGNFGAPGAIYQPPLPGMPGGNFGEVVGRSPASTVGGTGPGVARGQLGLPGVPDVNPFENLPGPHPYARSPWAARYDMLDEGQKLQINNMMRNGGLLGNAGPINDMLFGPDHPAGPLGSLIGEAGAPQGPASGLGNIELGPFGRAINTAANAVTFPMFIAGLHNQINEGIRLPGTNIRTPPLPQNYQRAANVAVPTVIGGTTAAVAPAVSTLGAGTIGGAAAAGAGALFVPATAFGSASGQEPRVDYTRPGGAPAPNFTTYDAAGNPVSTARAAGPTPPPRQRPASSIGDAGRGREADSLFGPVTGTTIGPAGSTPVHVTNPSDLPGGRNADAPKAAPAPTQPTGQPPVVSRAVRPTSVDQPVNGTPPQNPPAQVQGGPAQPTGPGGFMDYKSVYGQAPGEEGGAFGGGGRLPYNAQSPLQAFGQGVASVGNIANDAFQIFTDVIQNISATASIADTAARGIANTEDIVKIIQNFQTYLKTAADVAHMVSDIGGVVGAAGAGDPTGGAGAAGGAIQAIGAIVQSVIEGVNDAITIGIDIYHEVGKYAGFIFGEFLGGPGTGPLGGNVRMLLNTNTNQLYTYSEDNPLNKNAFNLPAQQIAYNAPIQQAATPAQVNIYAGPGQTPAGMMAESMWMVSTGAPAVASVAGRT